ELRFRRDDNLNIAENEAFLLSDPAIREQYALAYQETASLYFTEQIPFDTILGIIREQIDKL
ncbi:MAG: nucleotidyl transferase AbiEii/AbiGii toxin family protein, partial [Pseudomonadales bacterium]